MPDATAAPPAPETPPATQAAEQPKEGSDILEIVLEGMAEPVKIPKSKIPLDKLNPELAKFRAEADRRMSEVDRRSKEIDQKAARVDTIEKLAKAVQNDPNLLLQLAKELGMSEEALSDLSERQVASRIRAQIRADEEKADPSKKEAREADEERARLRKENEELRREMEERGKRGVSQQANRFIIEALETGKFSGTLKAEAAREMVPILAAHIAECKEDLSDFSMTGEQLAQAARAALRHRARFVYDEDDEAELTPRQLERAQAALAKRAEMAKDGTAPRAADGKFARHPAEGEGGKGKQQPQKNGSTGMNSSDYLLKLLRT